MSESTKRARAGAAGSPGSPHPRSLGSGIPPFVGEARDTPIRFACSLLALLAASSPLAGAPCAVPLDHPTIQAAVDDGACDPIVVSAGDYPESLSVPRSLALEGPGSGQATLWGRLEATGADVVLDVGGLEVLSGCPGAALEATGGARIEATDVRTHRSSQTTCNGVDRIFADGFETGDTSSW